VQIPTEAVAQPKRSEDVMIVVANGTATINGVVFDKRPRLTEIQQIFDHRIAVADLVTGSTPGTNSGSAPTNAMVRWARFALWFRPDIFEFVAKQTFAGKLFVEGRLIAAGTEFKPLLSGKPFKQYGEFGTSVDYLRAPVGVFVSADEEDRESRPQRERLVLQQVTIVADSGDFADVTRAFSRAEVRQHAHHRRRAAPRASGLPGSREQRARRRRSNTARTAGERHRSSAARPS